MPRCSTALKRYIRQEDGEYRSNPAVGVGTFLPPPVLSGIAVTPETALTFTSVFACINVISTDCATLPLNVCRSLPGGGRQIEPNDPRQDLVCTDPDGETTSQRFRQAMFGHVLGWGNGYAEIERFKGGDAAALHLQSPRPTDTRPCRTPITKRLYYEIDGGRRSLPPENILHVAGLGWDGLVGYSPIAFARQAVGLGIAAEQYGAALFGNASSPKGALKYPGKLSKEAMTKLRESWEAVHQGTVNAHRLAILEQGMEWQNISINPEDAQYLAGRAFQRIEMASIYRCPPHKIGDYSQAHLANLEESNLDYLTTTLLPWLMALEQDWNRKLFSKAERRAGLHLLHDMTALMRGNMAARGAYYSSLFDKASISPDEIRAREGLNPIPGGRQFFYPANNLMPLTEDAAAAPLPVAGKEKGGTVEKGPQTARDRRDSRCFNGATIPPAMSLANAHAGINGRSSLSTRENPNHDEKGQFAEGDSSGGDSLDSHPDVADLKEAHADQVKEYQSDHAQAQKDLAKEQASEVKDLAKEQAKEVKQQEKEQAKEVKDLSREQEKERAAIEKDPEATHQDKAELLDEHKEAHESLAAEHEQDRANLAEEHANDQKDLAEQHEEQKAELERDHQDTMTQLAKDQADEVAEVKQGLKDEAAESDE